MLYVVGRKGVEFYRFRNRRIEASWTGFSEQPSFADAREVGEEVLAAHRGEGGDPLPEATAAGWWFIRTAKAPELPVVLLEDIGAEIGLFLLFGLIMAEVTGNPRGTRSGRSRSVCCCRDRRILAIEMKGLLIGEAATDEGTGAIEAIEAAPQVDPLIHLRTMHLAPSSCSSWPRSSSTAACPSTSGRRWTRRRSRRWPSRTSADLHRARHPPRRVA